MIRSASSSVLSDIGMVEPGGLRVGAGSIPVDSRIQARLEIRSVLAFSRNRKKTSIPCGQDRRRAAFSFLAAVSSWRGFHCPGHRAVPISRVGCHLLIYQVRGR